MVPHCSTHDMIKESSTLSLRTTESRSSRYRAHRLLPGLQCKMSSPILLVARFRMFIAGRPLLPIGHHGQTIGTDTEFDQIVPRGFRPFFTEHEVVGGGPPLITVPFDLHQRARGRLHPLGIATQCLPPLLGNRPAVVSKKHISQACCG